MIQRKNCNPVLNKFIALPFELKYATECTDNI